MEENKILGDLSSEALAKEEEQEKYKKEAEANLAGWKRAMADYQNLKKETEAERRRAAMLGAQTVISAILPALDHFDEASGHIGKDDLEKGWVKGIMLIKKELEDVLKQFGVEMMKCVGEKFNPERHEAVGEADLSPDPSSGTLVKDEALAKGEGMESGKIIKEIQKGYTQNGEIIRPAKVILNK